MAETPMQGLAQWLREVAASPATSNAHWLELIRWASEVEAARARPQMPKPRDFAEVAREVEAARASLPAPTAVTNELPQFRTTIVPLTNAQRDGLSIKNDVLIPGARPAEPTPSASQETAMDSKPVAMRYRTGQGQRWRYLNLPHTKGWTFPPNLGVPEYLYAAPPSDTALLRQCLEALEISRDAFEAWGNSTRKLDAAIAAARQALEKP